MDMLIQNPTLQQPLTTYQTSDMFPYLFQRSFGQNKILTDIRMLADSNSGFTMWKAMEVFTQAFEACYYHSQRQEKTFEEERLRLLRLGSDIAQEITTAASEFPSLLVSVVMILANLMLGDIEQTACWRRSAEHQLRVTQTDYHTQQYVSAILHLLITIDLSSFTFHNALQYLALDLPKSSDEVYLVDLLLKLADPEPWVAHNKTIDLHLIQEVDGGDVYQETFWTHRVFLLALATASSRSQKQLVVRWTYNTSKYGQGHEHAPVPSPRWCLCQSPAWKWAETDHACAKIVQMVPLMRPLVRLGST